MGWWRTVFRKDGLEGNGGITTGFLAGESMPGDGESSIEVLNHDGEEIGFAVEYSHEDVTVGVLANLSRSQAAELGKALISASQKDGGL